MFDTRNCTICEAEVPEDQACTSCIERFPQRRPANEMSPGERVAEAELLIGKDAVTELPAKLLMQRIDELVGRTVWSHEIEFAYDEVIREAGTREHPAMDEVVRRLPPGSQIEVAFPSDTPLEDVVDAIPPRAVDVYSAVDQSSGSSIEIPSAIARVHRGKRN